MSQIRPSLRVTFKKLSIKWAIVGFALTLVVGSTFFFFLSKHAAEDRITTLAQSVTRAFRPALLDKDIRDAQFQMKRVLGLKDSEYVVVRDAKFETIYAPGSQELPNNCAKAETPCWNFVANTITYLQPIYFNDDLKDQVFGYVELELKNQFDWSLALIFAGFLTAIFAILSIGLSSTQSQSIELVVKTVNQWAKHLKESPHLQSIDGNAPFEELTPLEESISDLHSEIDRLNVAAANDAKMKTQISMVREIGHDLKTPFSQLAKFFAVFLAKVKRAGVAEADLEEQIARSMTRVGDLIRQVSVVGPRLQQAGLIEGTDILKETKTFIEDLKKTSDFSNLDISYESVPEVSMAAIPKIQFYRVLDNLVRNALDAADKNQTKIMVSVLNASNRPSIVVKDNGCGITAENIAKIFDAEFTTKPARGTGLGLSIVKKLCDDFLAEILVQSTKGIGTQFQISFKPYREIQKEIDVFDSKEATL